MGVFESTAKPYQAIAPPPSQHSGPRWPQTRHPLSVAQLREKARMVRVETLKMTYAAGSGHPGGSFSMAEAVCALYYNVARVDPKDPHWPDRDIVILSKGHCAPGLYAVLGDVGFFEKAEYPRLRRFGALLQGHVDRKIPGVEMSAGSLGMGLGYGNGCALAARLDGKPTRVYVICGDGELQEGNVWESAMTAAHRKLDSVCVIVDHNKIQIDGHVEQVKGIEPLADKWRAFGFHVIVVRDGHDPQQCLDAYAEAEHTKGKPTCIILETAKGGGVSFMADKAEYHGRSLKKEEMEKAMAELGQPWTP